MNTIELKKRFFSFLWRLGGMVAVALLAFVGSNLDLVNLPPAVIGVMGLIIGEVTKTLNKRFELGAKMLGAFRGNT